MKRTESLAGKGQKILTQIEELVRTRVFEGEPTLITDAILQDHKALKNLLKILKDEDETAARKKAAFPLFKSLLNSHTQIEEKVLYGISKHIRGLERKTNEGFVEHDVANNLLAKIRTPSGRKSLEHWVAQVQVLSELVEHHLKEEESDLLPKLRKEMSIEEQQKACQKFLKLREKTQRLKSQRNLGAIK